MNKWKNWTHFNNLRYIVFSRVMRHVRFHLENCRCQTHQHTLHIVIRATKNAFRFRAIRFDSKLAFCYVNFCCFAFCVYFLHFSMQFEKLNTSTIRWNKTKIWKKWLNLRFPSQVSHIAHEHIFKSGENHVSIKKNGAPLIVPTLFDKKQKQTRNFATKRTCAIRMEFWMKTKYIERMPLLSISVYRLKSRITFGDENRKIGMHNFGNATSELKQKKGHKTTLYHRLSYAKWDI